MVRGSLAVEVLSHPGLSMNKAEQNDQTRGINSTGPLKRNLKSGPA